MKDEPAFPCKEKRNTSSDPLATPREFDHPGMTLRDYFAGQALTKLAGQFLDNDVAWRCYGIADAMLKNRVQAL